MKCEEKFGMLPSSHYVQQRRRDFLKSVTHYRKLGESITGIYYYCCVAIRMILCLPLSLLRGDPSVAHLRDDSTTVTTIVSLSVCVYVRFLKSEEEGVT